MSCYGCMTGLYLSTHVKKIDHALAVKGRPGQTPAGAFPSVHQTKSSRSMFIPMAQWTRTCALGCQTWVSMPASVGVAQEGTSPLTLYKVLLHEPKEWEMCISTCNKIMSFFRININHIWLQMPVRFFLCLVCTRTVIMVIFECVIFLRKGMWGTVLL